MSLLSVFEPMVVLGGAGVLLGGARLLLGAADLTLSRGFEFLRVSR